MGIRKRGMGLSMSMGLSLALLFSLTADTRASVLGFDDLPTFTGLGASYGGFSWDVMTTYDTANYQAIYGNSYGAVSPSNFVHAGGLISQQITRATDFDFVGLYASTWASNDLYAGFSSTTLTVEGWDDGNLVYSTTVNLSSNQFDWFAFNYQSVDELRLLNDGSNGRWWLIDDFTFDEPSFSAVPEPATIAMWMIFGSIGLVGYRRRKRLSIR